jgi:hypothetical protein
VTGSVSIRPSSQQLASKAELENWTEGHRLGAYSACYPSNVGSAQPQRRLSGTGFGCEMFLVQDSSRQVVID